MSYLIRTIRVSGTKFLLTSNFVIFWVTKIAIRTSTDRTVRTGFTNSISTADNRSSTNILTFSLSKTKKRKRILNLVFELVWSVFKFTYSDKATNLCEISTVYLSYVVPVKSTMGILQNFVAFSEYINFMAQNLSLTMTWSCNFRVFT